MSDRWRMGKQVPINVYEGDRPVCQCHTAIDAKRIVDAVNTAANLQKARREARLEAVKAGIIYFISLCVIVVIAVTGLAWGLGVTRMFIEPHKAGAQRFEHIDSPRGSLRLIDNDIPIENREIKYAKFISADDFLPIRKPAPYFHIFKVFCAICDKEYVDVFDGHGAPQMFRSYLCCGGQGNDSEFVASDMGWRSPMIGDSNTRVDFNINPGSFSIDHRLSTFEGGGRAIFGGISSDFGSGGLLLDVFERVPRYLRTHARNENEGNSGPPQIPNRWWWPPLRFLVGFGLLWGSGRIRSWRLESYALFMLGWCLLLIPYGWRL